MKLRDYQQRSIDMLYDWLSNNAGNPCMVLPTGAGKSHIVAALCKDAVQNWPDTRVLMLTHQKELITQNAEKMREHWKGSPMGIYSASLNKKELGEPITFAAIQSVAKRSKQLGHVDLIIVDECHLISHKEQGGYRTLINELMTINPSLRVVGLTATPFRLGHGLITDKPALFDALIEPVSIEELIAKKHLAWLSSKPTKQKLDVTGVHKRGGEYIESELQAAVDTFDNNANVVDEVIEFARLAERKHWLFFCAGVDHAEHIRKMLIERGVIAECVTGKTTNSARDRILREFKEGKIQALTNANILTTGFDAPNIDLIALLRPTMSASLYVQMCGRGLRVKEHTDYCLVLDFAGVVNELGPITNVRIPSKSGSGNGEPPVRLCAVCSEIVHISVPICPCCGTPFPPSVEKLLVLHTDDIMTGLSEMEVASWNWKKHTSKTSGIDMLAVSYYGSSLSSQAIVEYVTICHDGYAGNKARKLLAEIAQKSKVELNYDEADLVDIAELMNKGKPPALLTYKRDGKFNKIIERNYNA
jgi:DNA repair protein RadD